MHKEEMEKQKKDPKGTWLKKNLLKRCNILMSHIPVVSMTTSLI